MNHTPEPWAAFGRQVIETISADRKIIVQCKTEEDAARIVACVNAMQGIEDPEGWMQVASTYRSWALQSEVKNDGLRKSVRVLAEDSERLKEAMRKSWDAGIVPVNPDDLNHHADYGVCDTLNSRREIFGTAIADSVPDPNNPELHIVEVLMATKPEPTGPIDRPPLVALDLKAQEKNG